MARYRGLGRDTVEETTRLTIDDLKSWGFISKEPGLRSGTLTLSRSGEKTGSLGVTVKIEEEPRNPSYIYFAYLLGYEKKPVEYEHRIELFPLHFGGRRHYFRCRHCNRRVTALYLKGGYYACRHCQRLAYELSQRHRGPLETLERSYSFKNRAEELRKRGHPRKANRLLERSYRLFQVGGAELIAWDELGRSRKGKRG